MLVIVLLVTSDGLAPQRRPVPSRPVGVWTAWFPAARRLSSALSRCRLRRFVYRRRPPSEVGFADRSWAEGSWLKAVASGGSPLLLADALFGLGRQSAAGRGSRNRVEVSVQPLKLTLDSLPRGHVVVVSRETSIGLLESKDSTSPAETVDRSKS